MTLEVIGAGVGRTGTKSLKIALEQLGFGPCHHMHEVVDHPEQLGYWEAAAKGDPVDWDVVFRGYRSQVDWPGARYWRELALRYPHAKVILSVRDPNEWFDSIEGTIARFLAARGSYPTQFMNALAEMADKTIAATGFTDRLANRADAIRVFEAHTAAVQATLPTARLLTFDPSQGWEALSAFLCVPAPDTPFPHANSSKEFHRKVEEATEPDARHAPAR